MALVLELLLSLTWQLLSGYYKLVLREVHDTVSVFKGLAIYLGKILQMSVKAGSILFCISKVIEGE